LILDIQDHYNVHLDGAIASVYVPPTDLMYEYRENATALRKEANVLERMAHNLGYELAKKQVQADKNLSKLCL
jgi:hypothetical protein